MNTDIYFDEIKTVSKEINNYHQARLNTAKKKYVTAPRSFQTYVILADGTSIEEILTPALTLAGKKVYYVDAFHDVAYPAPFNENKGDGVEIIAPEALHSLIFTDTAFLLFADTNKCHKEWTQLLSACVNAAEGGNNNYVLFSMLLPPIRKLPADVTALAEREYDFFLEKITEDKTPAEEFTIELGKSCREIVRNGFRHISVLRFSRLIGSLDSACREPDVDRIMEEAFEKKEVMITKEDHLYYFSCMFSRQAALATAAAAEMAKEGHVYNVSTQNISIATLKSTLQNLFPDEIAEKTDGKTYSRQQIEYHNVSSLKFLHDVPGLKKYIKPFKDSFYFILCSRFDKEFDAVSKLTVYQGKLRRLKETEIDILREIDRICRKHNIKYFLAGGSCLGAIRNGESIPWDDDLDIGMLREDFEIFRRVAPQEMQSGKFIYSSPQTDDNCHYYFDKIRLRDTYFSTLYSGKFVMDDGVFVDIVVYDNTTANKLIQKAQIKLITYAIDAIYIRWHDHPVARRRRISKYLLPVMRKIPFDTYHNVYDKVSMIFANKKDAKYLLDGGAHLPNGGFNKQSLSSPVEYVSYDGMENVPIPSEYPEYLSFLYGKDFRPSPNISARLGAHQIARLDLGKYLLENDPEQTFRSVDIRGELFEDEEES